MPHDLQVHGFVEPWWILVEDGDQETILHSEYFILKQQYRDQDATVSFTVPLQDPLPPQYFVRVISDKWIGAESTLPVSFRELLLPEKYPPPSELLDLAPLPVSALRNARVEALYSKRFKVFNPIQTQVFTCLYNTDDNALVCAPTGSGKTIVAEFALLRLLSKADASGQLPGKAVYVAPLEAAAHETFVQWERTFGRMLGLNVVELTGDGTADLKLIEKGQVIVATAERWDMVSRRWKQRKAVQATALFIADELHLIGGEHGPVLEVVTSRMRYMSSQQADKPMRIVGLATSLANAQDVGEWIGAKGHSLFNFHPTVRPVPLEVHIHGVDIINFDSRMQAMARPVYSAVTTHADDQPAIVYVPTRKHAKLAALDLLTFASAEGTPMRFLHAEPDDLAPFLVRRAPPPAPRWRHPSRAHARALTLCSQSRRRNRSSTSTWFPAGRRARHGGEARAELRRGPPPRGPGRRRARRGGGSVRVGGAPGAGVHGGDVLVAHGAGEARGGYGDAVLRRGAVVRGGGLPADGPAADARAREPAGRR